MPRWPGRRGIQSATPLPPEQARPRGRTTKSGIQYWFVPLVFLFRLRTGS